MTNYNLININHEVSYGIDHILKFINFETEGVTYLLRRSHVFNSS